MTEPQREWFEKDYYAVLGVQSGADDKDIKKAYKDLARKLHPDQNPNDKAAEERFKEVSAAYDVLGDKEKRSSYDEVRRLVASGAGPGGPGGPGGGNFNFDFGDAGEGFGGFTDMFSHLFRGGAGGGGGASGRGRPRGGAQRGRDLETEIHVEFADAARGVTVTVPFTADAVCSTCNGIGAKPGTSPQRCPRCDGSGSIAQNQGPFQFSQVCPECAGRGAIITDPCPTCRGRGTEVRRREVKVRVPAGVDDGQRIRVKERGGAGGNGGPSGDLYVIVHVRTDERFGRRGDDLTIRMPISFAQAALGTTMSVPTLEGEAVTIRIPPGTQPGKTLRVPGRGIDGGALLVTIDVQVPVNLTDRARNAIENMDAVLRDGKDTYGHTAPTPTPPPPTPPNADAGAGAGASTQTKSGTPNEPTKPAREGKQRRRKSDG